jgi:hypothetical protein
MLTAGLEELTPIENIEKFNKNRQSNFTAIIERFVLIGGNKLPDLTNREIAFLMKYSPDILMFRNEDNESYIDNICKKPQLLKNLLKLLPLEVIYLVLNTTIRKNPSDTTVRNAFIEIVPQIMKSWRSLSNLVEILKNTPYSPFLYVARELDLDTSGQFILPSEYSEHSELANVLRNAFNKNMTTICWGDTLNYENDEEMALLTYYSPVCTLLETPSFLDNLIQDADPCRLIRFLEMLPPVTRQTLFLTEIPDDPEGRTAGDLIENALSRVSKSGPCLEKFIEILKVAPASLVSIMAETMLASGETLLDQLIGRDSVTTSQLFNTTLTRLHPQSASELARLFIRKHQGSQESIVHIMKTILNSNNICREWSDQFLERTMEMLADNFPALFTEIEVIATLVQQ